jgi:hypothetical protein
VATKSKRLTIFEGPDGSGKTFTAERLAKETKALLIKHGPYPKICTGIALANLYLESMLPAILGYQDVVLDRSWYSERPYGIARRDGTLRIDYHEIRILERAAFRCAAAVVQCRPPIDTVLRTFRDRRRREYLETVEQARTVYDLYNQDVALPQLFYDYTTSKTLDVDELESLRSIPHPTGIASAGNFSAPVLLVGEGFGERHDGHGFYRIPFGSLRRDGCCRWLTERLEEAGVDERHLCWVNASERLVPWLYSVPISTVVGLGRVAQRALGELGIQHRKAEHPQFWKRFHHDEPYPLIAGLVRATTS